MSQPPRALSPRARRRAWAEQPVRLWLVLAGVVLGVCLWLTAIRVGDHLAERDLILGGEPATGQVVSINANPRAYDVPRDEAVRVTFDIVRDADAENDDVQPVSHKMRLSVRPGEIVSVGDELPLRVRDTNASGSRVTATDVLEPPPLLGRLVVLGPLLGVVAVLLVVAVLRRRGVLRVAREGQRVSAAVVSSKGSALAPRSRVLTVKPEGASRPSKLLHPTPVPVERLDVLHAVRGPTLAAELYDPVTKNGP